MASLLLHFCTEMEQHMYITSQNLQGRFHAADLEMTVLATGQHESDSSSRLATHEWQHNYGDGPRTPPLTLRSTTCAADTMSGLSPVYKGTGEGWRLPPCSPPHPPANVVVPGRGQCALPVQNGR